MRALKIFTIVLVGIAIIAGIIAICGDNEILAKSLSVIVITILWALCVDYS